MQAASQEPLLGEGSGLIQKEIRFNPLRQNSGQLIEKGTALQRAALLATLPGSTPHHLERALPQGQNGKRAFRAKQLAGSVVGESPQGNFGGEAPLAIADAPVTDAPGLSCWGARSISRNDQGVCAWIRGWFGQVHGHVAIGLQTGQQQLHQGPVIEDPANAVVVSIG